MKKREKKREKTEKSQVDCHPVRLTKFKACVANTRKLAKNQSSNSRQSTATANERLISIRKDRQTAEKGRTVCVLN